MMAEMTCGDLFAGIGGFSLGFERAGFETAWQMEIDKFARAILERHFPGMRRTFDVREAINQGLGPVDVVCGGDPCPIRSRARGRRASIQPDLAGYFLAVVGRLRPRWVVRENVPAPDAGDFAAALVALGYRTVAVRLRAEDVLPQARTRDFIVGCSVDRAAWRFEQAVSDAEDGPGDGAARSPAEAKTHCLTAHPRRLAEDTYCLEPGIGLRSLAADEREALQGFPVGWTRGLSWTRRCMLIGNAVPPPLAEWIARQIWACEFEGSKP